MLSALRYARAHRVLVVGATGNEGRRKVAFPARSSYVLGVGATTAHGCLAEYTNTGTAMALVAPGGGEDAAVPGDPNCRPQDPPGGDIYQMTFTRGPRTFGFPSGYVGTSMAAPHVSAIAALVIASGVIGSRPTPEAIAARLEATARDLGPAGPDRYYGAGLVDATAATAPGPPAPGPAPTPTPTPTPVPGATPVPTPPPATTPVPH
jgi:serine protease